MKAINIKWDIDNENDVVLPTEIEIPNNITEEDDITDYLSDVTGYCHFGYDLVKDSIDSGTGNKEICEADFISVWDGEITVRTQCKVDIKTHEVFAIKQSSDNPDNFDVLEREYIEINGNEYPIFRKDELNKKDRQFSFWYEG